MDAAGGIEVWSGEVGGERVSLAKQGSVVVLDGAPDLIAQLVAADPVLSAREPVKSSSTPMLGALASVATAIGSSAGASQQLFTLDPASAAAFANGTLAKAADGGLRLMQKGPNGQIASHGTLNPASLGSAQQMATAQIALVMVALMAAIDEVKEAVEQVQATVDLLRDHLEAHRIGQIGGLNAKLRRIADEVADTGGLSPVAWDEASSTAAQIDQHLVEIRSFINKRLATAEAEGQSLDGRVDALDHLRQLGEATTLLLVAEDNQFLYEQIRLHRIRDVDPDRLLRAVEAAAALVEQQRVEDQRLIDDVRRATDERVAVRELEIHRVISAPKLAATSARIDDLLATFADKRALGYTPIDVPDRPKVGDAARKLREEGGDLASGAAAGGRRLMEASRARMRRDREDHEGAAELESGRVTPALPPGSDEDVMLMVDLDKRSDRVRRRIPGRRNKAADEVER